MSGKPLADQLIEMNGDATQRFALLGEYIERMTDGEVLDPAEISIMEFLKKWASENVVPVYLAATASGHGGM